MAQGNKVCGFCGELGHSKFYCKKRPPKPIKRTAINVTIVKKPKKKRTETRGQLVKKLDSIFSKYIRYSAVEGDGMVQCVTCPTRLPPENMQNGHYQSRGDYPTRWKEDNCHPQCVACNVFRKGHYTEYAIFMINTYGGEKLIELKELAKSGAKITTPEIRDMIELYKNKVEELK